MVEAPCASWPTWLLLNNLLRTQLLALLTALAQQQLLYTCDLTVTIFRNVYTSL